LERKFCAHLTDLSCYQIVKELLHIACKPTHKNLDVSQGLPVLLRAQNPLYMPDKAPPAFHEFASRFPALPMPVVLGEDAHHVFSQENEPLTDALIARFILPLESEPVGEFTEFVPCFCIEGTEKYIALVWWRAELLAYTYTLATFTQEGKPIQQVVIASTVASGDRIHRAVANINEELIIHIAEGASSAQEGGLTDLYDPESTRTHSMELLPDGHILTQN
jgi:hypothetical protein